ncbi:MAG TPA: histidine kinase [Anaerolineales bacterium]|nr:histidine kinase [Anaerolineae bacterium]HIQ02696.1 histidine kinase [Anaerolineales bacterium]
MGRRGDEERIRELERRIADLKARLPKHSVPPAMIMELEELEEELARVRAGAGPEGEGR